MMEKLLELLKRVKPGVDWLACTDLVDAGVLDSLDIVAILAEIESAYGVEIDPDDIDPDNFQSAQSIYAMVQRTVG